MADEPKKAKVISILPALQRKKQEEALKAAEAGRDEAQAARDEAAESLQNVDRRAFRIASTGSRMMIAAGVLAMAFGAVNLEDQKDEGTEVRIGNVDANPLYKRAAFEAGFGLFALGAGLKTGLKIGKKAGRKAPKPE